MDMPKIEHQEISLPACGPLPRCGIYRWCKAGFRSHKKSHPQPFQGWPDRVDS